MSIFASGAATSLAIAMLVLGFTRKRALTGPVPLAPSAASAALQMPAKAAPVDPRRPPLLTDPPDSRPPEATSRLSLSDDDHDKYRLLAHKAKDAILTTNHLEVVDFINPSAQHLFGYSAEELVGKPLGTVLPRKVQSTPSGEMRGTLRLETVGRRKDGTEFPIELSLSNWRAANGKLAKSAIVRDATERHRAEASLRQSEENFRALIEQLPQGVLVHRQEKIVYVNTALRRLLQLGTTKNPAGQPLAHLYESPPPLEVGPRASLPPRHRDSALLCKDGSRVPVEATSLSIVFDGKPATALILTDVSEARAMQAQTIFADRMASIGALAAGVAHEVNNPLAYVLANLEFLRNDMAAKAKRSPEFSARLTEWQDVVVETREGAERVKRIAQDLKMLSRVDDVQVHAIPLQGVVQTSVHLASTQLHTRSTVKNNVSERLRVQANEPRLVQVFLNLFVNAAQAMPERSLHDNLVTIDAIEKDGWVTVEVRDNGGGIPAETVARIFEPFFTTKAVGVGTGLGLPISLDIMRGFGGDLRVESEVGVGSVFRLRLPAAAPGATPSTDSLDRAGITR